MIGNNQITPGTVFSATIVKWLSGALFVAWVGWQAATTLGSIETKIDNLGRDFRSVTKDVERLNNKIVGKTPEGYHRADQQDWCLETERQNKGWRCVNPYSTPRFRAKWGTAKPAN